MTRIVQGLESFVADPPRSSFQRGYLAAHKATAKPSFDARPGAVFKDDFFATPQELAEQLVAMAGVERHHTVLEPSAGEGGIAGAIYTILKKPCQLHCIEGHQGRVQTLINTLDGANVRWANFLEEILTPLYDRIVMNPPFSSNQDIRHVVHALKFLKPGGRLVAVMSAGVKFRTDRLAIAFRDLLERAGGIIEDLPEASFKASGTNVNAVVVTIDKARSSDAPIYGS